LLRTGDGRAEVGVGLADLDDGGLACNDVVVPVIRMPMLSMGFAHNRINVIAPVNCLNAQ
jgi:hypothetical protein